VLFSVDARKLGNTKDIRRGFLSRKKIPASKQARARAQAHVQSKGLSGGSGGPWDTICFNFPHVGGLSTDVNRQVRANQELLVAFFKASKPLLAGPEGEVEDTDSDENDNDFDSDLSGDIDEAPANGSEHGGTLDAQKRRLTRAGQILVTLFEGEPYTLWNIKDLARHAGLSVVTSFKFPWGAYPGYSHARTLGIIESRNGGLGGWRGEDRLARTYVFETNDGNRHTQTERMGKKRNRNDSESDD
jgi:25S rRNA (uracil2634-N3)-methyltransferase